MADSITYDNNGDARTFAGEGAVNVFAMAVIASGLRLYAKTGMLPNRAYTPTKMMAAAERYLGQTFKKRDYLGAAEALSQRVQEEKARIAAAQEEKPNNLLQHNPTNAVVAMCREDPADKD